MSKEQCLEKNILFCKLYFIRKHFVSGNVFLSATVYCVRIKASCPHVGPGASGRMLFVGV